MCQYRGIMQPSAASNQRDASQVASIHLSKNKSIELDNVCSWVLSHKTTGWMPSLNIFFLIQFLPRHNSKWFESNESVRNNYEVLKMKCGPRDHKDQRNWKLCSYHLWLTGVSSFDEASVVPVLLKQLKKRGKTVIKLNPAVPFVFSNPFS